MKAAVLVALALLSSTALAQQSFFQNDQAEVRIDTSPQAKPIRNKEFVTFAATVTFKTTVKEIAAGTRAYIYWTVDCTRGMERQVVGWVEVPGKPRGARKVEDLVKTAKETPFESPSDDLTRAVIAEMCKR